jgi:hypothetical protein
MSHVVAAVHGKITALDHDCGLRLLVFCGRRSIRPRRSQGLDWGLGRGVPLLEAFVAFPTPVLSGDSPAGAGTLTSGR